MKRILALVFISCLSFLPLTYAYDGYSDGNSDGNSTEYTNSLNITPENDLDDLVLPVRPNSCQRMCHMKHQRAMRLAQISFQTERRECLILSNLVHQRICLQKASATHRIATSQIKNELRRCLLRCGTLLPIRIP